MNKKTLSLLGYAACALFVVIGIVYFITPANHLPIFFPGHDASETKTHFKHGLAAIFLAMGAAAFAWFQSGPKLPQE